VIRFTLSRFRAQVAVAAAGLAVGAVVLAVTGWQLGHVLHSFGLNAACLAARPGSHGSCPVPSGLAGASFRTRTSAYFTFGRVLGYAVYTVPALAGMFWGAPLIARELAAGTHRLAWTQSITRSRWLVAELTVAGLASMIVAGLFSLMVTWWASPIDSASGNRFTPAVFGARGIVPVGYAAFALALGVTAGLLIRRTVPAMAVTLVVFAAVQVAVPLWVRPHLVPPVQAGIPVRLAPPRGSASQVAEVTSLNIAGASANGRLDLVGPPPVLPGAWVFGPPASCYDAASCKIVTASGRVASALPAGSCADPGPPAGSGLSPSSRQAAHKPAGREPRGTSAGLPSGKPGSCQAYLTSLHLRQVITYQPASRYWPFQWSETALFTGLALALAGGCLWWTRHRLT
jgi:hypothetical protein